MDLSTSFAFIFKIPPIIWLIIAVIFGVFANYILRLRQELRPIKKDLIDVEKFLKKNERKGPIDTDSIEFFRDNLKDTPLFGRCWEEFEETLVAVKVRTRGSRDVDDEKEIFYNTHRAEVFVNHSTLIDQNINVGFYESIPSVLTGIGLFGTFLSIILGLSNLDLHTIPGQVGGIQEFIESLGGKFVSSLFGLVFSVIFLVFEKGQFGDINKSCLRIQSALDRLFPQRVVEEILSGIQKGVEEQSNTIRLFNSELSSNLKSSFQEGIVPSLELIQKAVISLEGVTELLRQQKEESAGQLVDTIVSNFKSALTDHTSHEINELREVMTGTSTLVGQMNSQVSQLLEKMQNMLTGFDESMTAQQKRSLEGLEEISTSFRILSNEIQGTTKDFVGELRSTVSDMVSDNKNWSEEFRQRFSADLAQQTEFNHSLQTKIRGTIDESIKGLETAFDDHLAKVGSRMDGVLEKVTAWANESSKELSGYADALASQSGAIVAAGDSIKHASTELDGMFKEQKEFLETLQEATQTLRTVASAISESAERVAKLQEVSQDGIRILTKEMSTNAEIFKESENFLNKQKAVYEALDGGVAKSLEAINEASKQYADHTKESLGSYLTDFDKHLSDAVSKLGGTVAEFDESMSELSDAIAKTVIDLKRKDLVASENIILEADA